MNSALVAFLHHILAFTMFGCVFTAHLIFKPGLTLAEAKKILRLDSIFWISGILILGLGLSRVFWFEKGAQYYMKNSFFHAKTGLFVLLLVLALYPTTRFLKWKPALKEGRVPEITPKDSKMILMCLRTEMLLLVAIIACAAAIAKGMGVIPQ